MGGWSTPRPGRFTPGKDPVPIVKKAGWAPGPVWTCAENLNLSGIRSPDRPSCSESLYRLSYPGPSFRCTCAYVRDLSSLDWAVWLVQDDSVTSDHEMSYCFVPTLHAYGACRVLTMRGVKMIICHFETQEIHVMCQDATFQELGSTLAHHNNARSWESALSSC